jgi:hypothetical protein
MAQNNGFPKQIVTELKERLTKNKTKTRQLHSRQQQNNKWVSFKFHGPSVYKITNLLKKQSKNCFPPHQHHLPTIAKKPKNNIPSSNTCSNANHVIELM